MQNPKTIKPPFSYERESGQYLIYDKGGQLILTVARKAQTISDSDPAKEIADWILSRLNVPTVNPSITQIMNKSCEKGVKDATYGDTDYDSLTVCYGYNLCLDEVKEIIQNEK